MGEFFSSFIDVFQPTNFFFLVLCSVIGVILGAIPGLSGGLGISLILPITFGLSAELSFSMLLSMYVGGISGSFISAVLVGIPGSAASIATCFDGYPMTKKGNAARALTIGITGSFIGTFVSVIFAVILSNKVADMALMLGPWEYFSLCFMAISLVVGLSRASIYKGLLAAFIGIWLATVGADPVTNSMRFTFGNYNLFAGIPVVCLLLGTFAVQQVAVNYAQGQQDMPVIDTLGLRGFGLKIKDITDNLKTIITSFFLGLWIGFLPGMGSGIANMIAYGQAKKMSKRPDEFGTGIDEGVWASEVSNNAAVGGALIPTIALGIPGDGTAVLLLSAMIIHGLQPGPMFITQNPKLANYVFAIVLTSAFVIFILQLLTKRWFPYLLKAPYHYLYSGILMVCFVGAFSSTTSTFSIFLMLFFAVVGIVMDILGIPLSPMMLAYILGANLETFYRRGISYAKGDLTSFITRPVSCIFLIIGIYGLLNPFIKYLIKRAKEKKVAEV